VLRHDYLPFGEDTQPLTGDPMRFAGKELDPESALMNFEARYYRNTWGRFTQVDPVHVDAALFDPQQWNRYAYARNNPLAYGDPTGLDVTCAVSTGEKPQMTCSDGATVTASGGTAGPIDLFPGGPTKIASGTGPVYWVATHATNPDLVPEGYCGGMTDDVLYTTWLCSEDSGGGGTSSSTTLTVSVATLEATADTLAPEVVIPVVLTVTAIKVAHDNWGTIIDVADSLLDWTRNVFQARKPDLEHVDHLLDEAGVFDLKTRNRVHDRIRGRNLPDEEIVQEIENARPKKTPWERTREPRW
jgi:RHS repeat-associated protein